MNGFAFDPGKALSALLNLGEKGRQDICLPGNLPRLDEFFFGKARFKVSGDTRKLFSGSSIFSFVDPPEELEFYLGRGVLPLAPAVRYCLRERIRNEIRFNNCPNAPARWRLLGVLKGVYHEKDYGKMKWHCGECNRWWEQRPKAKDHRGCNGQVSETCTCCKKNGKGRKMERFKSLIHVSHAYRVSDEEYELRMWGWIPEELPGGVQRFTVLKCLKEWLGVEGNGKNQGGTIWSRIGLERVRMEWRERREGESGEKFLRSLLNEEGEAR